MQLSKHFDLSEFVASATAQARGIDNTPPESAVRAMRDLCTEVLEPLRMAWGRPITITSGYRCKDLNRAVGGAASSQHMTGHAADISTGDRTLNRRLFDLIRHLGLPFDQLIDEHDYAWVHVSYDPRRNRRQVLRL